jgi:RNA polymerase sigma-70 factor (ECF subfamily)
MTGSTRPLQGAEDFQKLYQETYLNVFRFIYALHGGTRQDIEDLTSETYYHAWKARSRFQGNQDAAMRWLLRISRNLVYDSFRRQKIRRNTFSLEEIDEMILIPGSSPAAPDQILAYREDFVKLWSLIQELNPNHREILLLRYMMGWRVNEIAAHIDNSENNVSATLRRILQRLQRAWTEEIPELIDEN